MHPYLMTPIERMCVCVCGTCTQVPVAAIKQVNWRIPGATVIWPEKGANAMQAYNFSLMAHEKAYILV